MLRCTVHGGLGCQRGRQGRIDDRPICRQGAAAGGLVRLRARPWPADGIRAGGIWPRIKPKVRGPCVCAPPWTWARKAGSPAGLLVVGSRPKKELGGPCGHSQSELSRLERWTWFSCTLDSSQNSM